MQLLRDRQLYAKLSKCSFGQPQIEYLSHLISNKGVVTDYLKVESMLTWPKPMNIKALRGFLGLTGYYKRFVEGYGIIAQPLTNMLKKEKFQWSPHA